jgi:hypothetical protein
MRRRCMRASRYPPAPLQTSHDNPRAATVAPARLHSASYAEPVAAQDAQQRPTRYNHSTRHPTTGGPQLMWLDQRSTHTSTTPTVKPAHRGLLLLSRPPATEQRLRWPERRWQAVPPLLYSLSSLVTPWWATSFAEHRCDYILLLLAPILDMMLLLTFLVESSCPRYHCR